MQQLRLKSVLLCATAELKLVTQLLVCMAFYNRAEILEVLHLAGASLGDEDTSAGRSREQQLASQRLQLTANGI